jgi:S-DNA-T family DNA segregation ATPase FtsK/SpoIIIE
MLEERNLKLDLLALGVLALTIFLAASLLGYHPADAASRLVYPEPAEVANLCGRSGALASAMLLSALGLGAYYLVVSLAVLAAVLLVRRPPGDPLLRLLGWLLSLVGFSTFSAMALPGLSPGPVIGPGGYLGAAGRGLLEMNFAAVGAYIVVASLIAGGLLLSTEYLLVRWFAWIFGVPLRVLGQGVLKAGNHTDKAAAQSNRRGEAARKRPDTGVKEDGEEEDGEEENLTVRIAGRQAEQDPADAKAGDASSPPDDQQSDQPGISAPAAKAAELQESPLRVRNRKSHREELIHEIEETAKQGEPADYELPGLDLLLPSEPFCFDEQEKDVRRKAKILEKTFADFGFSVRVVEIQTGPVIAQFEVELEAGLRLSRITGLADDLAIALRVPSVRIVAPIPGKNTVGIEVPNSERQLVRLREVIEETNGRAQAMRIPVYLGKDVAGNPMIVDLASMPHLLIAGRTGTGKSVCLNSIIVSMLMTRRPDEVRMLLIDPKMVELSPYKKIPHLMHPVVTDMKKAEAILAWAVEKMEERYALLTRAGVRHLSSYNQLGEVELMERVQPADDEERQRFPVTMPYIVIVADEMADLMMTAAKEVEAHIIRLAQKSRAVGIHLVMATQKPTVDVITGLIKSNLPARICFQVTSRTDSRVVLDEMGADKLLGNGDLLFLRPGTSALIRGQGTYLSDDEMLRVIGAVATSEPQFIHELVQLKTDDAAGSDGPTLKNRDELYEAAVDMVVREGRGSVSLLQRGLGIGYGRAARLIDFMAEDGLVGPYNGSQAREILISLGDWETMRGGDPSAALDAPARRPSNKITLSPNRGDGAVPATVSAGPERNAQVRPVVRPSAKLEDAPFDGDEMETPEESYDSRPGLSPRGDSRSRIDFRHDDQNDPREEADEEERDDEDSDDEELDDEDRDDEDLDEEEPDDEDLDDEDLDEDESDEDESGRESDEDLFVEDDSQPNDLDEEIAGQQHDHHADGPQTEGSPHGPTRPWHAESA